MIRYVFKEAPITIKNAAKADPQKIGEALAKIADENGGKTKPQHVVDAAKDRKSPLHRYFEWDDAKAAASHRLDQARTLIRVVRSFDEETQEAEDASPAFLSVSEKGGVAYRSVGEVQSSAYLQTIILQQAIRDLDAWRNRYRVLTDVCSMVAEARDKLNDRLVKAEADKQETRVAA